MRISDWSSDVCSSDLVLAGIDPVAAREMILLVGLTNDVSLRGLIPGELAKGFGFFQSKPASAMSPVFVTPQMLGDRWRDGKLPGALCVDLNGQPLGQADRKCTRLNSRH